MLHFGLEQEFFLVKGDTKEIVFPEDLKLNLPIDSCGYLVEARGRPYNDIFDAAHSVLADTERIQSKLKGSGYELSNEPVMKLPRAFMDACTRRYTKGLVSYQNYLGFSNNRISATERTAGIHLSVTDQKTYEKRWNNPGGSGFELVKYNQNFDWLRLFQHLDKSFSEEIKEAKRNKGFYELKVDGRIEYRSLPMNASLVKLVDVVNSFYKSS